jgi:hypothetical protein
VFEPSLEDLVGGISVCTQHGVLTRLQPQGSDSRIGMFSPAARTTFGLEQKFAYFRHFAGYWGPGKTYPAPVTYCK